MKMIVVNYLTILQNCDLHFFINNPNFEITSILLNSIQVGAGGGGGGGQKTPSPPHTSLSPVTSTNVETGAQNFQTFSFNPFTTLL